VFIRVHAFHLTPHAACEHVPDHFEVADERPERMLKGGGAIFLNDKMSEPGKGIADNEEDREKIPAAGPDEPNEQYDPKRGADQVEKTGERLAVFLNVEIPEFFIIRDHCLE